MLKKKIKDKLTIRNELIGSGLCIASGSFIFYAMDPLAHREILAAVMRKILQYCLFLIGFNLWLRVKHRIDGVDPDSMKAIKAHTIFTSFFLFMLMLSDLYWTFAMR
jgi:hypothetical protein